MGAGSPREAGFPETTQSASGASFHLTVCNTPADLAGEPSERERQRRSRLAGRAYRRDSPLAGWGEGGILEIQDARRRNVGAAERFLGDLLKLRPGLFPLVSSSARPFASVSGGASHVAPRIPIGKAPTPGFR